MLQAKWYAAAVASLVLGVTTNVHAESHSVLSSSEIVGANVQDSGGEKIGTIYDLVMNKKGQSIYAILAHGGVLGIGTDYYAVPCKSLHFVEKTVDGDRTVMAKLPEISKAMLDRAPSEIDDDYEKLGSAEWREQTATFFKADAPKEKLARKDFFLASDVLDADLRNNANEDLAPIDQLVFDTSKHEFCHLLVDRDATVVDNELTPVPLTAVTLTHDEDGATLVRCETTASKLDGVPKINVENLARLHEKEFSKRLNDAFPKTKEKIDLK